MNKKLKVILLMVVTLIAALLITSCGEDEHYVELNDRGHEVSVKFDANGGEFTTGVSTIVDTYDMDSLPTKNGKKVAKLIKPDDSLRGSGNTFTPGKSGYIFVGWYTSRQEITGDDGETTYAYSNMWDFKNDRLELDPNKEYSAENPAVTLYAAWIPKFTVEVYSKEDPTVLLDEFLIDINELIKLPTWDKNSGKIKMEKFPTVDGKTFEALYLDPEGKVKLTGKTIEHTALINYENATVTNSVMRFYMETVDGDWRHITSADQLKNMVADGNYIVENDIDLNFKYSNWASYMVSGKFTGKLIGKTKENGEPVKIMNIRFEQAKMGGAVYTTGLFGQISEGAVIENIAFENVTMEMTAGAPLTSNVSFGLLAGTISSGATINNVTVSGVINVNSACKFQGGYTIGLVCGVGDTKGIDDANITCVVTGDNPENITVEIYDGKVELVFAQAE